MVIELLAVLSIGVAAGMRIGLPLLMTLLLYGDALTSNLPLMGWFPLRVLIAIFTSWALLEVIASKQLLGQRAIQILDLACSPFIGAVLSLTVIQVLQPEQNYLWLMAVVGGLIAFVFKLILMGWFFRLRGLPIWWSFAEDFLSVLLVILAFRHPIQGGMIAILLFCLALRSSSKWKRYDNRQKHSLDHPD